jgi:hypothetical protein
MYKYASLSQYLLFDVDKITRVGGLKLVAALSYSHEHTCYENSWHGSLACAPCWPWHLPTYLPAYIHMQGALTLLGGTHRVQALWNVLGH